MDLSKSSKVSFHFDLEAMLSRQYLVPSRAFCMALAEAGLFAEPKSLRCFPVPELCVSLNLRAK